MIRDDRRRDSREITKKTRAAHFFSMGDEEGSRGGNDEATPDGDGASAVEVGAAVVRDGRNAAPAPRTSESESGTKGPRPDEGAEGIGSVPRTKAIGGIAMNPPRLGAGSRGPSPSPRSMRASSNSIASSNIHTVSVEGGSSFGRDRNSALSELVDSEAGSGTKRLEQDEGEKEFVRCASKSVARVLEQAVAEKEKAQKPAKKLTKKQKKRNQKPAKKLTKKQKKEKKQNQKPTKKQKKETKQKEAAVAKAKTEAEAAVARAKAEAEAEARLDKQLVRLIQAADEKTIEMSQLPRVYRLAYSADIPYQKLGHENLKSLIGALPSVSMPNADSGCKFVCCTESLAQIMDDGTAVQRKPHPFLFF